MLPVMSSTSHKILRSLGQRSRSRGSWLKSQNYIFVSKRHTFWYIVLELGTHVTCYEFYILSKVKVIEVMAAAGALYYANTFCFILQEKHFFSFCWVKNIFSEKLPLVIFWQWGPPNIPQFTFISLDYRLVPTFSTCPARGYYYYLQS